MYVTITYEPPWTAVAEGLAEVNLKNAKARLRAEAGEEARQDKEMEARLERRLRNWTRASVLLGVALAASIAAVIPYFHGHPLHYRWEAVGKRIMEVSGALFLAFTWVAETAFTFWYYLRGVRKTHRRFAPPGSEWRTHNRQARRAGRLR